MSRVPAPRGDETQRTSQWEATSMSPMFLPHFDVSVMYY